MALVKCSIILIYRPFDNYFLDSILCSDSWTKKDSIGVTFVQLMKPLWILRYMSYETPKSNFTLFIVSWKNFIYHSWVGPEIYNLESVLYPVNFLPDPINSHYQRFKERWLKRSEFNRCECAPRGILLEKSSNSLITLIS